MQKLEQLCTGGENVKSCSCYENSLAVPQKLNKELLYDPAIPPLRTYLKELQAGSLRYLYSHVYSSVIHNNQKMKANQMPNDR